MTFGQSALFRMPQPYAPRSTASAALRQRNTGTAIGFNHSMLSHRGRMPGSIRAAVAAVVALVCVPATAAAGEARIEGVTVGEGSRAFEAKLLRYDAEPGEVNDVLVVLGTSGTEALVRDAAGVSLGSSCRRADSGDPTAAICDFGELADGQDGFGRPEARLALGDGDDRARVEGSRIPGGAYDPGGDFDGGPGDDLLVGGLGANRFDGGPGNDHIDAGFGCGGGGVIDEGTAPNGSDTFEGAGSVL